MPRVLHYGSNYRVTLAVRESSCSKGMNSASIAFLLASFCCFAQSNAHAHSAPGIATYGTYLHRYGAITVENESSLMFARRISEVAVFVARRSAHEGICRSLTPMLGF